ncbi:MAG: DUF5698 domain-containing protein [Clostridia bacterium]|nr:DUF5698 domain-containing protein [bacterium]MCK9575640.1 DUF5698 domain-containing protein [Clostridia bacterium]MDD4276005.1 DUF5698 domain-containing protein [Clostridia bacterium]
MEILILCLSIFFCRILDVSLGVARTILSVKGKSFSASIIGFIEVLIWFLIVKNALNSNIGGIYVALAYASGFATGTLIGGYLSSKFIKTKINVQIITSSRNANILKIISENGFPATIINASGIINDDSDRYMLVIEIQSCDFKKLKNLILSLDKHAFIFVSELTQSINGYTHIGK